MSSGVVAAREDRRRGATRAASSPGRPGARLSPSAPRPSSPERRASLQERGRARRSRSARRRGRAARARASRGRSCPDRYQGSSDLHPLDPHPPSIDVGSCRPGDETAPPPAAADARPPMKALGDVRGGVTVRHGHRLLQDDGPGVGCHVLGVDQMHRHAGDLHPVADGVVDRRRTRERGQERRVHVEDPVREAADERGRRGCSCIRPGPPGRRRRGQERRRARPRRPRRVPGVPARAGTVEAGRLGAARDDAMRRRYPGGIDQRLQVRAVHRR